MADSREYAFEGTEPSVHDDARVARDAVLVGEVRVGADASVWPQAVLRGDVGAVEVGARSHVGDGAVLHAASLGEQVMVGHGAVVNDAAVGDGALVGFNATLNAGVTVGAGSILASGTVVPEDATIPEGSFVRGVPARVTPVEDADVDPEEISADHSSGEYAELADRHEELF